MSYKVTIEVLDEAGLLKVDEVATARGLTKVELNSKDGDLGYQVTLHAPEYMPLARSASLLGYDVSEIEHY